MNELPSDPHHLLTEAFGLSAFRPFQEEVCRAVAAGDDVLLVMPTGAGKSLCYQLPGLARGGTTLVVSPLIALMEDQVGKLRQLGLAAERIHSGRGREASRQVCRDYLAGRLSFLFIAPERLAVPGFPEMLAKRLPALVAVDEAHCISQWGHDFRPDYRRLGQWLPAFRPAPIIALTATATPRVQEDIAEQLGMAEARRHIHGFRRANIAVEVVEMPPSRRRGAVAAVLGDPGRRPAIVYAPTRKECEALASELARELPAAAYHAGMTGEARERVQERFLEGELEVMVATIAFGMGVDKSDVRTVIHTALPGSLEAYYQEIGRAGRDGLPSRALLLCSWADRRTHEFFHQRDYPEPEVLERIFSALPAGGMAAEEIRRRLDLDEEVFARALEKLWTHGGARVTPEGDAARGEGTWRSPYLVQREHRLAQLDDMSRFTDARRCRMLHLVEHFGDQEDSGDPCGICDMCDPGACRVRRFRPPSPAERQAARRAVEILGQGGSRATGRLHQEVTEPLDDELPRRAFEELLGALARAGLVALAEDSFEKNGRVIRYKRASLTADGHRARPAELDALELTETPAPARRSRSPRSPRTKKTQAAPEAAAPELVAALKAWRLAEARARKVPAFTILQNRTLLALAASRPASEAELLEVSGIGPRLAKKFGERILEIVAEEG